MYLGITLNKLDDFESACQAFEKALEIEQNDCTIYLNYAIMLYERGFKDLALVLFKRSEEVFALLEEDDHEPEMLEQRDLIAKTLN